MLRIITGTLILVAVIALSLKIGGIAGGVIAGGSIIIIKGIGNGIL